MPETTKRLGNVLKGRFPRAEREESVDDLLPPAGETTSESDEPADPPAETEPASVASTAIVEKQQTVLSTPEDEEPSGIQLVMELEAAGGLSPIGLELADPALSFERWTALGRLFGRIKRSTSWWIGDWLNFGADTYGERIDVANDITGLAPQTLMNYASVAKLVPRGRRRHELPFSTHAAVAKLEPAEQIEWLQKAVEQGWDRATLRRELNAGDVGPDDDPDGDRDDSSGVSKAERIAQAAKLVVARAQRDGPEYRVEAEAFDQLIAAVGKER